MKWEIEFYKTFDNKEPVKNWLENFDKKTKSNIYKHLEKLERKKLNLNHTFVNHLETQLYQMNIKDDSKIYKILFSPNSKRKIVLLHGFIVKVSGKSKKIKKSSLLV